MASIIVAFPNSDNARQIRNLLVRNGFNVNAVCVTGAQVLNAADDLHGGVVISGHKLKDMVATELKDELGKEFDVLVVASEAMIQEYYFGTDIMTLGMPLKTYDLINSVDMMCQQADRRRRKAKLKPKVRNPEEEKLIRMAKEVLMDRNHMTEEEAHRYLQKCSMDSGTGMVETAQMVLAMMK